jgi:phage shock protein A
MSDEEVAVRKALVEAIAAQKLIEQKIAKYKLDLSQQQRLQSRLEQDAEKQASVLENIAQIQRNIAEFEADRLAQGDLEKQLRETLFRLETHVRVPKPAPLPDFDSARATMDRLENRVVEAESLAELQSQSQDKERKLLQDEEKALIDDELAALKKSLHKEQD